METSIAERTLTLRFKLRGEVAVMDEEMLASALVDGLPDEWWDEDTDGWFLESIEWEEGA